MSELEDILSPKYKKEHLPSTELSEEEIRSIVQDPTKDFKAEDDDIEVILEKVDPNKIAQKRNSLKNLIQYSDKPRTEESKEASLKNLRPPKLTDNVSRNEKFEFPDTVRDPQMIANCLTRDEIVYFIDRWTEYYKQYGSDLNSANDYDQLVELIMNLIDLYRIQKKKKKSESFVTDSDLADVQHKIHSRIQNILTSLKTRRKDRIEMNQHDEDNLVKFLCSAADKKLGSVLQARLEEEELEETKYIEAKSKRKVGG